MLDPRGHGHVRGRARPPVGGPSARRKRVRPGPHRRDTAERVGPRAARPGALPVAGHRGDGDLRQRRPRRRAGGPRTRRAGVSRQTVPGQRPADPRRHGVRDAPADACERRLSAAGGNRRRDRNDVRERHRSGVCRRRISPAATRRPGRHRDLPRARRPVGAVGSDAGGPRLRRRARAGLVRARRSV